MKDKILRQMETVVHETMKSSRLTSLTTISPESRVWSSNSQQFGLLENRIHIYLHLVTIRMSFIGKRALGLPIFGNTIHISSI